MTLNADSSHSAILSDSLQRLQLDRDSTKDSDGPERDELANLPSPSSKSSRLLHEGYGFRPPSGASTPPTNITRAVDSPLPDRHGLGWPGSIFLD